jgi:hypothetical protein
MSGPQRYTVKRNRDEEIAKQMMSEPQPQTQPSPGLFGLVEQAARGYWDRQGRMANQGLQMAEGGANSVKAGNFSGLPGAVLGPLAYLGSPVGALFPERSEVDAATDVPDWSKPFIAGGLETMAIMAPGPKTRGLGRGLDQLADQPMSYALKEQMALKARLEAEAAQAGEVAASPDRVLGRGLDQMADQPMSYAQKHKNRH